MENVDFNVSAVFQFESCESRILLTKGSIRLRDAYDVTRGWPSNRGHGVPGTAILQAKQLLAYLDLYAKQSAVFRELLVTIATECVSEPIILYLGRYSSTIFDSAMCWTVDIDDYLHLHQDYFEHEDGYKYGVNIAEAIIHLLEERLYMKKPAQDFTKSHLKCLSSGSFQNRYRIEQGCLHETLDFELDQHTCKETPQEVSNWESFDASGTVMKILNIHTGKMFDPLSSTYVASTTQIVFERVDIKECIMKKIANYQLFISKEFQLTQTVREEDRLGLEYWIKRGYSNEEADAVILATLGPLLIGLCRKKTWNVLRVYQKKKLFTFDQLKKVGDTTFMQNYKQPIPVKWNTITYPFEVEIENIKTEMLNDLVKVHSQQDAVARELISQLALHF